MLHCRKNQASLTATEKSRFVAAVLALKASGKYDQYVQEHLANMPSAHRGPAFLPWHREYLRRFELDLQAIDASVTLPYWNWTVDNSPASSIWNSDFMGGNGRPSDGRVMTGAFAYDAGSWTLIYDGPALRRRFGTHFLAPTLPTGAEVTTVLGVTPYDASPYTDSSTLASFRNRLEGWYMGPMLHNQVHLWVGGSMNPASSPNDPVFFLHHCYIDKLWADWQTAHPTLDYVPVSGAAAGHDLMDPMEPWASAGDIVRPSNVLDHHALGYAYDTEGVCLPKLKFVDDPLTLKFSDDGGTIKAIDDHVTLKQLDDPITLKFNDDGGTLKALDDPLTLKVNDDVGTLKALDDPITIKFNDDGGTLKQVDDPITNKFADDGQQTNPRLDPIKMPGLDKPPGSDQIEGPEIAQNPQQGVPFILSTPHHSMAWQQKSGQQQRGSQEEAAAQLETAIQQHEEAIKQVNERHEQGRLSEEEMAQAQQLFASYQALVAEYQRLKS